ncbi:hypothetical protein HNR77_002180 [Paenibacillus sp. JGP012]|nr:hypothetical protein [Paenibacillus sp. JGP012]
MTGRRVKITYQLVLIYKILNTYGILLQGSSNPLEVDEYD